MSPEILLRHVRRAWPFVPPAAPLVRYRVRAPRAERHALLVPEGALLRQMVGVAVLLGACSESGTELASTPTLVSLSAAPLQLIPPFAPGTHDYVVRCGPGPNSLMVSMPTAPGVVATIETPTAPTDVQADSVSLDVHEDQAIVVDVAAGSATQQYWIRCLPHDFPALQISPHPDAGTPSPGWYLLGNATTNGDDGFAMVLDGNGTPVWYQRLPGGPVINVDRRPDGSISYIGALGSFGSDPAARYLVQTLDPWRSRTIAAVGGPTDEHELQSLANGDVLLFSYPLVTGVDLTGLTGFGAGATIADCVIQEVAPNGRLVWQWRGTEHIDPAKESTGAEATTIAGQNVADVFHCNSIDVDARGDLLVSARNLNAVFSIDRASGRIAWKMGGAAYSKDGARLVRVVGDPEGTFSGQHDARLLPNGDVTMFDDHTSLPGVARGVEYAIDLGAATARVVWEYRGAVSALAMGSFRRYADGSNVIAWGMSNQPTQFDGAFTEVDDAGNDLLDVSFMYGDSTYRTVKLPLASLDLDVLRKTAGHP